MVRNDFLMWNDTCHVLLWPWMKVKTQLKFRIALLVSMTPTTGAFSCQLDSSSRRDMLKYDRECFLTQNSTDWSVTVIWKMLTWLLTCREECLRQRGQFCCQDQGRGSSGQCPHGLADWTRTRCVHCLDTCCHCSSCGTCRRRGGTAWPTCRTGSHGVSSWSHHPETQLSQMFEMFWRRLKSLLLKY